DRVGQAGAEIIAAIGVALLLHEHLRLVLEPAERGGVDDAVAVALPRAAKGGQFLGMQPAEAFGGLAGIGGGRLRHAAVSLRQGACDPIVWAMSTKRERPMNLPPTVTPRA